MREMQCSHCGSKMPEGSIFCQVCGQKIAPDIIQQPAIQPAKQKLPHENLPSTDRSSQLLDRITYLFRKSGAISKKINQNTVTGINNISIIISEGIHIILASINAGSITDEIMENLVLQKFRFDAFAIFLIEGETKMKPAGAEVINKLSRNAIVMKKELEIRDRINAIPDTISEYDLLTTIMEIFDINQSDENGFILQAKGGNEISAMADSLREKIKFLKKKNNNP